MIENKKILRNALFDPKSLRSIKRLLWISRSLVAMRGLLVDIEKAGRDIERSKRNLIIFQ
jgi:hypothetical protein